MSTENLMLFAILFPIAAAIVALVVVRKDSVVAGAVTIAACFVNLFLAYQIYGNETSFSLPWAGWFFEFTLRNYQFSSFILIAVALFGALLSV